MNPQIPAFGGKGKTVLWDKAKLERFKAAYLKAVNSNNPDVFEFEGNQYVEGYAKYLIEFLDMKVREGVL